MEMLHQLIQYRHFTSRWHTIKCQRLRYYHVLARKISIILVLCLAAFSASAQYDPHFAHYWAMETSYNPAAAGKEAKLNIVGAYAHSFAGFENNPRTMYVSADMPFVFLNSIHGAGLHFMNDKIGLFSHQRIALQYDLQKPLFGGTINVGVQAGLLIENFNGSDIELPDDPTDEAFSKSEVKGQQLDLAVGLYYKHGPWYLGASVLHLNAPKVELGETNEINIDRTYYFTAGYNIKLRNPFLTIHPTAMFKYDGTAYRGDVTARLVYTLDNKMFYAGVGYSPTNSVTAYLGGSLHGVHIGYSYEMYTGGISLGNGSHELCVKYQTDINLVKKGKNKHKSVRIL